MTFPPTGGVDQYLEPDALQYGYVMVDLFAKLTDVLGNETSSRSTRRRRSGSSTPRRRARSSRLRLLASTSGTGWRSRRTSLDNESVYDVTYQYRPVGEGDLDQRLRPPSRTTAIRGTPTSTAMTFTGTPTFWPMAITS